MALIFEKFSKKKSEKLINFLSLKKWEFLVESNLNKKNLQKMIGNNFWHDTIRYDILKEEYLNV